MTGRPAGSRARAPIGSDRAITILALVAGAFGSLDSALNIAFPDLVDDLGLDIADLRWVVVCFVASYGLLLVMAGRLGDRFDHRRVLVAGGVASVVALVACASASSYPVLLGARVGQGLATALVMAGAPALLSATGAGATGAASTFQAAAGAGLAIGPLVGGPLVAAGGWPAVFWFRVPIAVVLVALGIGAVARPAGDGDGDGAARLVGDDEPAVRTPPPGPAPDPFSPGASMSSRRSRRTFLVANGLTAVVNGTVFVVWLLVPALLLDHLGLSASAGGVVLAASPLATAVASAIAGRLVDRHGPAPVSGGGVALSTAGLVALAAVVGPALAAGRPALGALSVAAALVVVGFGLGLFSVPNMALIMDALPADRQGTAGGLTLMMRTVGIVVGVNAAGLLFGRLEAAGWVFVDAFRFTVGAAVAIGVVALTLTAFGDRVSPGSPRR